MPAPLLSPKHRARTRTARRRQFLADRRPTRLWGEMLEPRLMMAVDTPDIVVGRTLSAYSASDVQNNQLKVTYTVYNQEAAEVSGVLLTTTLQAGASFVTASQLPDQNGQELAWSLGAIPAYGRSSVEVTIDLANNAVLTIDDGAEAFSTLNARASSDAAPAAVLNANPLPAALLASTTDANTNDPFIQEQAARLDYDPQKIIDFLQDEVGYESYVGSLRGARGTLWSSAGNALDEASLGVALFRASGIPAQYAAGTLSDPLAQQLILSMFPESYQTVGYIPAGMQLADPANDPQLLSETRQHYWIQFDTGGTLQDIDTSFANSTIGQTFVATTSGTFSEVADNLRHKVQLKLDVESYSQASATFGIGDGLGTATVLNFTFSSAELVGRPLTLGHLVTQDAIGSPIFVSRTTTYVPYLRSSDEGLSPDQQPKLQTGTSFQEVATNFPFGNQLLTAMFLTIDLVPPGGPTLTYERALFDRIGYAARQGSTATSVSVDPNDPTPLTAFDLHTLNILPGRQSDAAAQTALRNAREELARVNSLASPTALQQVDGLVASAIGHIANFALASDVETANIASAYSIAAYFNVPRITMFSSSVVAGPDNTVVQYSYDLIRDSIRALAVPGQNPAAVRSFATLRGAFDSYLESQSLPVMAGAANFSSSFILQLAEQQGVPLVTIDTTSLGLISTLNLPPNALARITSDVQSGLVVIAPQQTVSIAGREVAAWWILNPETGELLSRGQDGGNFGSAEYVAINNIIVSVALNVFLTGLTQAIPGPHNPQVEFTKAVVFGVAGAFIPFTVFGILLSLAVNIVTGPIGPFIPGPVGALAKLDPPVPPLLVNSNLPFPTAPGSTATGSSDFPANASGGAVTGTTQPAQVAATGSLTASWTSNSANSFLGTLLEAGAATVLDSLGAPVAAGVVALSSLAPVALEIAGGAQYNLQGEGRLTAYGAGDALQVSGEWSSYDAAISGNVSIRVTTSGLAIDGVLQPAGTYTINTTSARLQGAGETALSTFDGTTSISAADAVIQLGPGSGNLVVGGTPIELANGITLSGYQGSLAITAAPGDQDSVSLNGTTSDLLRVSTASPPVNADQNNPVIVPFDLSTTSAETYSLKAIAPEGWTVVIQPDHQVVLSPKPGTQGGVFPVRIIAQSQSNSSLLAAADVMVTVSPTAPGLELDVIEDSTFTVPVSGAQIPTSFQATMRNLGPVADSFDLTFPSPPAAFNILRSADSLTVPAGETGFTGIYLEPNGVLPAPGTLISFTVTATSRTNPLITQTETFTFEMPAVAAVTVDADPGAVSTIPGAPVTANVVVQNVGNVPYNLAIGATLPNGLAVSGLTTPVLLAVGQSTTQMVTLTPAANTPLNSTLTPTFTYGPAVAANQATVLQVNASNSHVEAGQTLTVSADLFAAVLQAQQGSVVFVVKNSLGAVVQTSTAVPIALGVVAATKTVNLGSINTTGLAAGEYTIEATVRDANNVALPGAVGVGKFVVGLPIAAIQDVTPGTVNEGLELTYVTGNATVQSSVQIGQQPLVSLIDTNGTALNIALSGNLAYIAGTKEVTIVDLSNPASPQIVGSFGADQLGQDALNVAQIVGSNLVIGSQSTINAEVSNIIVYSLTNPLSPQLVSTTAVPYRFLTELLVQGTTAIIPTSGVSFTLPGTITNQFGDVVALNLAGSPTVADVLFNTNGSPNGGTTRQVGGTIVNSSLVYVGSSTFTGNNTTTGAGRVLAVNIANPANLSVAADVAIPGMKQVLDIAIDGNRALVVGSTGTIRNPFNGFNDLGTEGTLALAVLDITNPASPVMIGTTKVTEATFPSGTAPGLLQAVSLGNGQFAISGVKIPQQGPAIVVVDATNAADIQTSNLSTPALVNGLSVSGSFLHASSAVGLATYRIAAIVPTVVQVEVQIPNGTGVSVENSSFNISPTQTIVGAGFNTLVWDLTLNAAQPTQELTWNTNITGMIPGTTKSVTLGTTISADSASGPTSLSLPAQIVASTPATQSLQIPVRVAVPGADAIAAASVTATQTGRIPLANRLSELSTSLTVLVQNPGNRLARSQSLANIDAINVLLTGECCLGQLSDDLLAARATLAAAFTPTEVQAAVVGLGNVLEQLADLLVDLQRHDYQLDLLFNQFIVQPDVPARFDVFLQNIGTQTTTYDFVLNGLPATATSAFNQTSITLAPGEYIGAGGAAQEVFFTITQSGLSLAAFGFTLSAIPREAPLIVCPTEGSLALRSEFIGVATVALGTNFTQAGPTVPVTANVISTVNSPTNVQVFYEVRNSSAQVVFTSAEVPATLNVSAPFLPVVLPGFDTTGVADGTYSVVALVKDELGVLIPGATATTTLLIGTPLSATLTVADRGGLNAEFFDFTTNLSAIPNFTGLTPDVVRLDNTVNYTNTFGSFPGLDSRFADTFAARHTGVISIPTTGSYTFYLSSDEGSRLYIDGVQVINNDGLHGQIEVSGTVPLTAGFHDVRIEYFENASGAALIFSWAGPGILKQIVPESVLYPQATTLGSSVTLQPGTRIVNNELQIDSQTAFTNPLTFRGIVDTNGLANSVVTYGNVAYVSGSNDISIVDISDPSNPQVLSTFANSLIVQGGFNISRIVGNMLIVGSTVTLNANGFNVLIYDLTNPLSPSLVSNTPINYRFISDFLTAGSTVLATTNGVYFFGGGSVFDQFGDVVSLDITNPAAPVVGDALFNNRGPQDGGNTRQLGGTFVNNTTAYIASTTSTGGNTLAGTGRVLVVDTTNPADLVLAQSVLIPGTVYLIDVAVQGNRALAVGTTAGAQNPFNGTNDGFIGNLSLTLLDTTDPLNPTIIGETLVTSATFPRGAIVAKLDAVSLGNGLFAVSEAIVDGLPVLLLVDPSDPNNLVVSFSPMPALQNGIEVVGDKLYTTSSAGLSIFDIGQLQSIPLTASVQIPKNTGVSIVPGSFNIPPSQIVSGPTFDTLVWNRNLAFGNDQFNFTWQSTVTDLQPGEVRDVTLGAEISSLVGNSGTEQPLNFTTWSVSNLVGDGSSGGNWVLSDGNTKATQTINGLPTSLLSDFSANADRFAGDFRTNTSSDDDFIGFIFGYQDSQHFYVFDWKQNDQNDPLGFAERGMSLKVVNADTPLAESELWQTAGNGTRVQNLYHNTISYADFTDYHFELLFTPGTITITVSQGATVLDTFTVNDSTYQSGKFGFYNYSQSDVVYSGFTREELVIPFAVSLPETTARALPATRLTLGLTPPAQTLQPGDTTNFVVTVNNPNATAGIFNLSTAGIPADWVTFPASVNIPANGSVQVPLQITSDVFAQLGDQGFTVIATNGTQQGFVQGSLTFVGPARTVDSEAHGVFAEITPNLVTTGQGQPGTFGVRVTNTGSATDTFDLTATLPPGFTATFEQTSVVIPPGESNFREISVQITPPAGTLAAVYPFTIEATSTTLPAIASAASANLSVVVAGVDLALNPPAAPAATTFQLTVRNTGSALDTFDLALAGPGALVSTLAQTTVTLAPGASAVVNVNVGAIDFAVQPSLQLAAVATSRNNSAVQDFASAEITIPLTFAMDSRFDEDTITLTAPGPGTFLLLVNNLGNGADDYEARIIATSGPLSATLIGLDGAAVQTVPIFRLPGLSTGAIVLNANLVGTGIGTITVQVRSLTNDTILSQSVATLRSTITDFGDAPDTYGTTLAADGARHLAVGPQLGANRDPEIDATPSADALGDDNTGEVDDEDGVILPGLFVAGNCDCSGTGLGNQIIVNATAPGFLDAWIDFNRNGVFDPNERIANSFPVQAGANSLIAAIPTTASHGLSFARFRLSSTGGLGPTGAAADGEVEDHAVQLFNPVQGSSSVVVDPNNPNGRVLYIKGTQWSDAIVVRKTSTSAVTVYVAPFGTISSFPLSSFDRIVICGFTGSDSIAIEAPISKPSVIYGDEDQDSISGGLGSDIIFGGPGNDAIAGWAGDDVISGGTGVDSLVGGLGFDRLVESGAGSISLSNTLYRIGNEYNAVAEFEAVTLTGSSGSDSFNLSGWTLPATIDGGGGSNTIIDSGNGNFTLTETSLVRVIGAATRTLALANIQNATLSGGIGNNAFNLTAWPFPATLRGESSSDTFSVAGDVDYTLNDFILLRPGLGMIRLDGFENATLTAGSSDNTFHVSGWSKAATLNGAGGNDKVVANGNVNFTLTNTTLSRSTGGAFTLSSIEEAELTGGAGNNTLNAATFSGSVKLDGGSGNDTLQSGPGIALLLGGLGNDVLTAGSGRAVMIGGTGLDRLTGGSSDDLLIAGQTAHDANAAALAAILAEWTSASSYADRLAHLTGTTGTTGGLNADNNLNGTNVTHDTAIDLLFGGTGDDLFFAKLDSPAQDILSDRQPSEMAQ